MGSQSVTNFSAVRMKRIHSLVRDYSPTVDVAQQAKLIGEAAVGTLEKGPTHGFAQTLANPSVETGLKVLMALKRELEKNPQGIYKAAGVGEKRTPLLGVSAFLKKAHAGLLTTSQAQTDSAFAANDAIPKTIIDLVSKKTETEAIDVSAKKLANIFKNASQQEITAAFMENVAAALIDLVLDATRGNLPPARVNQVKKKIREHFVPELIEHLMPHE